MTRISLILASLLVGLLGVGVFASPASGSEDPPGLKRFEKAQAKRDFVVYAPTKTFGIPMTSFKNYACDPQSSPQLSVNFGSDANPNPTPKTISLAQSSAWCTDGPDPIGPVTTFTFGGSEVQISGACPGTDGRECKRSTPALVKKRFGYITVILPGTAAHPSPTHIEIYSTGLSVAEIRAFVRGLVPAK